MNQARVFLLAVLRKKLLSWFSNLTMNSRKNSEIICIGAPAVVKEQSYPPKAGSSVMYVDGMMKVRNLTIQS